jgi:hypothetical protein
MLRIIKKKIHIHNLIRKLKCRSGKCGRRRRRRQGQGIKDEGSVSGRAC